MKLQLLIQSYISQQGDIQRLSDKSRLTSLLWCLEKSSSVINSSENLESKSNQIQSSITITITFNIFNSIISGIAKTMIIKVIVE